MTEDAPPDGTMPGVTPTAKAMGRWDEVIADMEATAAEYEEAGYDTIQLHPGDVTVVGPDHGTPRLDVLVPDNEHAELERVFEDLTFEDTSVFRTREGSMVYLLVVEEAREGVAVLYPAYYSTAEDGVTAALEHAAETGRFRSVVRRLQGDPFVFEHDDPAPFVP